MATTSRLGGYSCTLVVAIIWVVVLRIINVRFSIPFFEVGNGTQTIAEVVLRYPAVVVANESSARSVAKKKLPVVRKRLSSPRFPHNPKKRLLKSCLLVNLQPDAELNRFLERRRSGRASKDEIWENFVHYRLDLVVEDRVDLEEWQRQCTNFNVTEDKVEEEVAPKKNATKKRSLVVGESIKRRGEYSEEHKKREEGPGAGGAGVVPQHHYRVLANFLTPGSFDCNNKKYPSKNPKNNIPATAPSEEDAGTGCSLKSSWKKILLGDPLYYGNGKGEKKRRGQRTPIVVFTGMTSLGREVPLVNKMLTAPELAHVIWVGVFDVADTNLVDDSLSQRIRGFNWHPPFGARQKKESMEKTAAAEKRQRNLKDPRSSGKRHNNPRNMIDEDDESINKFTIKNPKKKKIGEKRYFATFRGTCHAGWPKDYPKPTNPVSTARPDLALLFENYRGIEAERVRMEWTTFEKDCADYINEAKKNNQNNHYHASITRLGLGTQKRADLLDTKNYQNSTNFNATGSRINETVSYEEMLRESVFGFVPHGDGRWIFRFSEVVAFGAIPIVIADGWQPPFGNVIKWEECAVFSKEVHIKFKKSSSSSSAAAEELIQTLKTKFATQQRLDQCAFIQKMYLSSKVARVRTARASVEALL